MILFPDAFLGGFKLNIVCLSQNDGAILGPVAMVLGKLLNVIFVFIDKIGFPNVALAIFLFTVVINLILLPLTIKQQKFSKLSAKMNPEIQAIQARYKGKTDQESKIKMNEEVQLVYKKYGVSPTGSCVYLIIQMPILFALYRVIYNIPAYVISVKEAFYPVVNEFINKTGALEFIKDSANFSVANQFSKQFNSDAFNNALTNGVNSLNAADLDIVKNTFIDVLNRATTTEWANIYASNNYPELKNVIISSLETIERYYNLFGLNIANSPMFYIKGIFSGSSIGLAILALLIPILAAFTQWLNTKLMPQTQPADGNDTANAMAASMKSMNVMMPLMSMVFCFTLPIGLGLYWILGAVVRGIQQVFVNKHIDKMDLDAIVEKNQEKVKKQIEKNGVKSELLKSNASISTKAMSDKKSSKMSEKDREEAIKKSTEYYNKGVKPDSLAAKANMVKQYNEKNNKN